MRSSEKRRCACILFYAAVILVLAPSIASAYIDPGTGLCPLGDMCISLERAVAQAKEYGHSTKREVGYLTIHSMLHLLGYDHIEDDEAEVMEAREDAILRDLALERGEDPKLVHVGPITNHAHD